MNFGQIKTFFHTKKTWLTHAQLRALQQKMFCGWIQHL